MKSFICPFCNEELDNGRRVIQGTYYICNNHKLEVCILKNGTGLLNIITINSYDFKISIVNNEEMRLYNYVNESNIKLPFDNKLTPDNFEERLEIYLKLAIFS